MDEIQPTKTYELAYHLIPDLEEAKVKERMGQLEQIIAAQSGRIVFSREPRRMHLSYPIEHKHYAYFGAIEFAADAQSITHLNSTLKLEEGILRFMILKKDTSGKEMRTFGDRRRSRPMAVEKEMPAIPLTPEEESAKKEKMEKEIADVLEKI